MKHSFLTVIMCLFTCVIFAQTRLYENPNFDKIAENHQVIAILPFKTDITLRPKDMKNITPEQLERMEISEGENIQTALYSWFLTRQQRGSLTVKVQDIAATNAKLLQSDITAAVIPTFTPQQLAGILEVDAIIMGTFSTDKPMSEGAAAALGVLFGVWGPTNMAVINLFIYNAEDGEVLVNYNKGISGSSFNTPDQLINILMRKASRRIAYTK
jgi:hypothetical protein